MSDLNSNAAAPAKTGYDLMIRNNSGPPSNTAICKLCREFAQVSVGNDRYYEIYDHATDDIICPKCAESIDEAIANLVTGKTELPEGAYFGDCPKCGKNDGYLNVNRNHYFLCKEHKTCWGVGSNLFSSWKDEDESIWEENVKTLSACRVVEDWHRWAPSAPEGELEWVTAQQANPVSDSSIPF